MGNDLAEMGWFLVQSKPNCTQIALRHLSRQGFGTFLPVEDETRERNGKFLTMTRPLFPGYIFVSVNPQKGLWRSINATYGVSRLVSFGSLPAAVPQEFISELMARCDAEGKLLPPDALRPGDQVVLTQGPFANFVAQVQQIAVDRRIWLLMELMGSQTRIAARPDQLRAV